MKKQTPTLWVKKPKQKAQMLTVPVMAPKPKAQRITVWVKTPKLKVQKITVPVMKVARNWESVLRARRKSTVSPDTVEKRGLPVTFSLMHFSENSADSD